jgi:hypothetical protein
MQETIFQWSDVHGPTSRKIGFESLGPLTECEPRRITMHQNVDVLIFFNTCSKRGVLKKIQV